MRLLFGALAFYALVAVGRSQPLNPDTIEKLKGDVAANRRSSVAHFRLAESYLLQKEFQSAANEFREALNGDQMPRWTEVWSHIDLGKIFDITGQCDRGVNEYSLALRTGDDAFGAQAEIDDYLNSNIIRPLARLPAEDDSGPPSSARRTGKDPVTPPILLARTEPEYSEAARLAGLEGTVLLKALIAEDGSAADIRVARPLGLGLDEEAVAAVRKWRFTPGFYHGRPTAALTEVAVDFFLPSRQSRWHLVGVSFRPPEGATEPVFVHVEYPPGSGVASAVIDDARLVNAMRRFAAAKLSFDVDEDGAPVHVRVDNASDDLWGIQALAVIRNWRFKPGEKNGMPVSVPGTIDLIWGERNLSSSPLEILRALDSPYPQHRPDVVCRTKSPIR